MKHPTCKSCGRPLPDTLYEHKRMRDAGEPACACLISALAHWSGKDCREAAKRRRA